MMFCKKHHIKYDLLAKMPYRTQGPAAWMQPYSGR